MKDEIRFLPLLLLYIFIVLIFSTNTIQNDEVRYVRFANNLSHGFYSKSDPDKIDLWNGPGYPIVLLPFVILKLPWLTAKLLNAFFLFGTVLYFYYTLCFYIRKHIALFFSYLLGIYTPMAREVYMLLTEPLTIFLISGFSFYFCKAYQGNRNRWVFILIPAGFLGFLVLTKIFFGYILLIGMLLSFFLYLWRKSYVLKKTLLIYLFAFIFCLPYLFYTYSLTGKIFYWGNPGGLSLYWMSTPYEDELGDWFSPKTVSSHPQLRKNHQEFFEYLSKFNNNIQIDDELKKRAIFNIIHNPQKFFKNWIANIGRLLLNYPYSFTLQRLESFYFLPNIFIIVLFVLCIYPTYCRRKLIPYEIYTMLLFGLIAFAGSSLLSAYPRHASILAPVFLLWIFFTLTQVLKIEIRK